MDHWIDHDKTNDAEQSGSIEQKRKKRKIYKPDLGEVHEKREEATIR